jgi:hypothetical protein
MPPSGEAAPSDQVVPWVGADSRVEVDIAPVARPQDRFPEPEQAAEPERAAEPEPAAADEARPPVADGPAATIPEEPIAEPSDDEAGAAGSSESAASPSAPPRLVAGMPVGKAVALAGLAVVVIGLLLVTVGPVSVRFGGDPPAERSVVVDEGARGAPPQGAATATASASPSTSAAPADADGSDLPLHEGYLVVEGANPKLYVYGRGKRLGRVTEKMKLRCGALSVRLGDRAPEHWYSAPERVRVECQSVTTETIEPTDPVSILEEAVPAEVPTSDAAAEPTFQPPPPSLPPPPTTGSGPDWVPPEI